MVKLRRAEYKKLFFTLLTVCILQFIVLLYFSLSVWKNEVCDPQLQKSVRFLTAERNVLKNLRQDLIKTRDFDATNVNNKIYSFHTRIHSANKNLIDYVKSKNLDSNNFIYDWYRLVSSYTHSIGELSLEIRLTRKRELQAMIFEKLEALRMPQLKFWSGCPADNELIHCDRAEGCGAGCRTHHDTFCLLAALATNRTIIQNSDHPPFAPIGAELKKCEWSKLSSTDWKPTFSDQVEDISSYNVLKIPIIDVFDDKSAPFVPMKIPKEIDNELKYLSEKPFLLFVGIIMKYQFRSLPIDIREYTRKIGLMTELHYVGLHVRRTDKQNEAELFPLSKYMERIEEYYDQMDYENKLKGLLKFRRNIYLATDEPKVWTEEVPEYTKRGFIFYGDPSISKSALPNARENKNSQLNLLLDIHMLSNADHIVCTFSSQICRIAYELMQVSDKAGGADMSIQAQSLDNPYYFGGQLEHGLKAVVDNTGGKDEHSFVAGDVLGIAKDLHNGFFHGDHQIHKDPSSVVDYIRAELRRGYFLQNDEQRYKERREKFYIFLSVPVKLEAFIFFGLLQCIDAFLMIFTVLPFRFLFAIILLVSRSLRNLWRIFTKSNLSCVAVLNPAEICDLLKGIIILSCSLVMMSIDSSYIYHQIKSQSVIKLYIFYNMLEVADKMLSSFGQDVLETLYWTATEPRKRPHFVVFHLMFAIVYVCMHSFLTLLQASTLNVAINSKNQALLTVMMSNNFVELKSMVFKKFEKTNLFHMSCSDVRERFHYIILITVVIIQTMEEYNWSEEHFFDLISVCVTVFITEIIVDWFKHSFVTRFNEVPTNVYEDYTLSLAYDLVGSKLKTAFSDHTDIISRRMGFIPLPLSVLIIRIFAGSFNFTNFFTILCMSLLFVLLIISKLTLNVGLLGYSLEIIEERREIEEKANKKSASLPVSRHNSVSDLTQLVQEQPNDLNSQQQQVPPPKPIPVVRSNSMGTRSTPHSPSSSLGGSLENITEHLQNSFDTSMILSDSTVSLTSMNDGQNIALPPGSLSERKSSEHATFNRKLKKKLKQKFPFSALSFRRRISLQNEFQHLPSPTLASSAAGDQRHGEIRQSAKWFGGGGGGGGSNVRENDEEEQDENRPPSSSYDTTTTATATIDVPGGVHKKDPTLS